MKKVFILLMLVSFLFVHGEQELQTHNINVENGDATITFNVIKNNP